MSSTKLLTISIPTWNRSKLVGELLKELTSQIQLHNLSEVIEILVSNNASEDNTDDVVSKLRNKYSFITYNRNTTNIGGKCNVLKSMELAQTEFVLFLGDDDRLNIENLKPAIEFIKSKNDIGILLDTHNAKFKYHEKIKIIDTEELVKNFFWNIGNAGCFIARTDYFKNALSQYGYDFFSEYWPQTQIQILGLENSKNKCYAADWNIQNQSVHSDVTIYTSYYVWRTCYYELLLVINDLKDKISQQIYNAARVYLKESLPQQFFNILQCAVFIDDAEIKRKTRKHIFRNLHLFSAYEKIILWMIVIALSLPAWISKPLSNIFIFCLKGKRGIKKKNAFVLNELSKKVKYQINKTSIRTLEFEN